MNKTNRLILISSFILITIDQVIKHIIYINKYSFSIIKNFFRITYVENKGAAFGFLSDYQILLAIIGIVFIIFFIKYIFSLKHLNYYVITYSIFIISGVIGNLIDRVFRGFVIDYLDFNLLRYDFPVFNLADILIVVGVLLILLDELVRGKRNEM